MKTLNKVISFLVSGFMCLACFPFYIAPVHADSVTYFSYGNYVANTDGTILYGANVNYNRVHGVILNYNSSANRSYKVAYVVCYHYVASENESDDTVVLNAWKSLNNLFGSDSTSVVNTLFKGIRFSGVPGNWSYGNPIDAENFSSSWRDSNGRLNYVAGYDIIVNPNSNWLLSCYAKRGTPVISSSSYSYGYLAAYFKYLYGGGLTSGYTLSSFAGGWVHDDTSITPVYTPGTGDNPGQIEGDEEEPSPSPTPSEVPGGSESSGNLSQWQTLSVQTGAFAFTVEDGAIQNSNTIEENAVNVTVNNNNSLNNENIQNLNNLINNVVDTGSQNAINEGINAITGFTSIARTFSGLMAAVLGFLPAWVTTLLALLFVLLFVMIVFRLIHLFI